MSLTTISLLHSDTYTMLHACIPRLAASYKVANELSTELPASSYHSQENVLPVLIEMTQTETGE